MALDLGNGRRGRVYIPKTRKAKPKVTTAPHTDAQTSGRNYGIAKADRYKKTPAYHRTVRVVQKAAAAPPPKTTGRISGADLSKAERYQRTPEFQSVMRDAAVALHRQQEANKQERLRLRAQLVDRMIHNKPTGDIQHKLDLLTPYDRLIDLGKIASVTYHHPDVILKTGKEGIDTIKAAVPGLAALTYQTGGDVLHARFNKKAALYKVGAAMVADWKQRGHETAAQKERRYREHGYFPDILDMLTPAMVATGGGGAVAGKLARAGALGERAARFATETRPALRLSGGDHVFEQPVSNNLLTLSRQRAIDSARARKMLRHMDKTSKINGPKRDPLISNAVLDNAKEGRVYEVTPYFRRTSEKAQRLGAAKLRSRAIHAGKAQITAEIHNKSAPLLRKLNKHERKAFFYVGTAELPIHASEETIRAAIESKIKRIKDARAQSNMPDSPGLFQATDEIKTLEYLKNHIHEAFTERLAQTIDELRPQNIHLAREAPHLAAGQAIFRRYAPHAENAPNFLMRHATPEIHLDPQDYFHRSTWSTVGPNGERVPIHSLDRRVNQPMHAGKTMRGAVDRMIDLSHGQRYLTKFPHNDTMKFAEGTRIYGAGSNHRLDPHQYSQLTDEEANAIETYLLKGNARDPYGGPNEPEYFKYAATVEVPDFHPLAERYGNQVPVPEFAKWLQDEGYSGVAYSNFAEDSGAPSYMLTNRDPSKFERVDPATAYTAKKVFRENRHLLHQAEKLRKEAEAYAKKHRIPITPGNMTDGSIFRFQHRLPEPFQSEYKRMMDESNAMRQRYYNSAQHDNELIRLSPDTERKFLAASRSWDKRGALENEIPNYEPRAAYIRRLQDSIERGGYMKPLYFPEEKYAGEHFGSYATGGSKAVRGSYERTGSLAAVGRRDTRPETYLHGLAQTMKVGRNWNLVADQFESHAFQHIHYRDEAGVIHTVPATGQKLSVLKDTLARAGVDSRDVRFWNPGRYREAIDNSHGSAVHEGENIDELGREGSSRVEDAIKHSTATDANTNSALLESRGWSVIPTEAYNEIMHAAHPSGFAGRAFDIFKGKQARVLLGTNPSWLMMQVASNGILAGFGTAGRLPLQVLQARRWWKELSPEQRQAIAPYLHVGVGHGDTYNVRLGAASNNRVVNAYRAFKEIPAIKKLGKVNPIEGLFKADHAQNEWFRKQVLYDKVKRDALDRMTTNLGELERIQARVTHALSRPPKEVTDALVKHHHDLERYSDYVNKVLGDYLTYTHRERMTLQRYTMFYGFLRYSLKFLFHTMPIEHPGVALAILQVGNLQREEIETLLGGDDVPWAFGKIYWTRGGFLTPAQMDRAKHDKEYLKKLQTDGLRSIDISRAHPALNSLTNLQGWHQLPGLLPPAVSAMVDQVAGKNLYKDRGWAVLGHPANPSAKGSDFGNLLRARIYAEQLLQTVAPYRFAEKYYNLGVQGDDSMLFDPRPTHFSTKNKRSRAITRSVNRSIAQQKKQPHRFLRQIVPFIPEHSLDPEVAARLREAEKKRRARGKGHGGRPRKSSYSLGTSSSPYGGSAGNPYK